MKLPALLLVVAALGALSPCAALSPTEQVARRFFEWFKSSEGVAKLHQEHVASESVQHMIKGTPLATAPDEKKIEFAKGGGGAAVASFMKFEQRFIGDWKCEKIIEAAGPDFDAERAQEALMREVDGAQVVCFSFVDCPWCLLAKERLCAMEGNDPLLPTGGVKVIELEDLGRDGKSLRAALALSTGRTSMPSIWVGGRCVGGFTDGEMPGGDAERCLADSPGLEALLDGDGRPFRELLSGGGGDGRDDAGGGSRGGRLVMLEGGETADGAAGDDAAADLPQGRRMFLRRMRTIDAARAVRRGDVSKREFFGSRAARWLYSFWGGSSRFVREEELEECLLEAAVTDGGEAACYEDPIAMQDVATKNVADAIFSQGYVLPPEEEEDAEPGV